MNKIVKNALIAGSAALATSVAARAILRHRRRFNWRNKNVILTGGSRGLGLCLARRLVDAGANVALLARSEDSLEAAIDELQARPRGSGSHLLALSCDVADQAGVESAVAKVSSAFGSVDVLINNAGIIEVGPLDSMTRDDFQRAMDTHCWGTLNTVRAVLPSMRDNGWGRILNIASLGGKRAVPHMLPYAASKFALVGLSGGLRAELASENILVTTVCPGLMRTGSPRNARFKGQHRKEFAWFSIGDSLPLFSLNADAAAAKILQACQHGDPEVTIAGKLNFSNFVSNLAPNWTIEFLSLAHRVLPKMDGIGSKFAYGYQSESNWSPSFLTKLTNEAAVRNNEILAVEQPTKLLDSSKHSRGERLSSRDKR